jgi:hypothetical protein
MEGGAAGATNALVGFVGGLRFGALSDEVRHCAKRHLMDTVGVMIAGAGGEVATGAEAMLASVRPAGGVAVPGRRPRHRARRRLPAGLGASGLRGGAGTARPCRRTKDIRHGAR